MIITPAIKYLNIVIPAKAGIQVGTGCRIKSGMTELDYLIARLIYGKTFRFSAPHSVYRFIVHSRNMVLFLNPWKRILSA